MKSNFKSRDISYFHQCLEIFLLNVFDATVGFLRTDAKGVRVVSLLREDIEIDRQRGGATCLIVYISLYSHEICELITLHT